MSIKLAEIIPRHLCNLKMTSAVDFLSYLSIYLPASSPPAFCSRGLPRHPFGFVYPKSNHILVLGFQLSQ